MLGPFPAGLHTQLHHQPVTLDYFSMLFDRGRSPKTAKIFQDSISHCPCVVGATSADLMATCHGLFGLLRSAVRGVGLVAPHLLHYLHGRVAMQWLQNASGTFRNVMECRRASQEMRERGGKDCQDGEGGGMKAMG